MVDRFAKKSIYAANYKHTFLLLLLMMLMQVSVPLHAATEDTVQEQLAEILDLSSAKNNSKGNWVPVPIPVANPTIGNGLQAVLLYLHPQTSNNPDTPNTTSGLGAMYTDTNSWFVGGFHDGNWNEDLLRYKVLVTTLEFNLDFFGIGDNPILREQFIPYTITSNVLFSQLVGRIPSTKNWYSGLRYMYSISDVTFDLSNIIGLPPISANMITSSLAVVANYDSRNDNYYPTDGHYFEIVLARDSSSWGSDFEFDKVSSFYNYYLPVTKKNTIALRVQLANAKGNTPFYLLPSLNMRGFPLGKYKDDTALSGHMEWRYKFHLRWGFVTFYELGSTADTMNQLFNQNKIVSYGTGIRWQVTKNKKLNLGMDIAVNDNDYTLYVQIGERY